MELKCTSINYSEGVQRTKLYDKKDGFNFPIVNSPFICSNILAYRVYLSQLIRYFRACVSYDDFFHRGLLLIGVTDQMVSSSKAKVTTSNI